MTWWLITDDAAMAIAEARKAGLVPTNAQIEAAQREEAALGGLPRSLTLAGDVAEIGVRGVLTKNRDIFLEWFGGGNTSYRDIAAALATADADPNVKRAVLNIDSPGGTVDGLFDALAAIEKFSKPLTARASLAASAAYAIASMADTIVASNHASMFGSIGVAVSALVLPELVTITSTEAPEKRPDLSTDEGKAMVRKHLDDIHSVFVDAIAKGRDTTTENVNTNFGRGAVVLAADAKKRGMIDSIAQPALRPVKRSASAELGGAGGKQMDREQLKSQHPELYASVLQLGATQERDRVTAHLTMGEQSGDMQTACKAIRDGSEMTQTLTAQYLVAGMARADRANRQTETDAAAGSVDGAPPAGTVTGDLGDQVVAILEKEGF